MLNRTVSSIPASTRTKKVSRSDSNYRSHCKVCVFDFIGRPYWSPYKVLETVWPETPIRVQPFSAKPRLSL